MTVTVKVEGLSELKSAFEQLPKATGKSVMRKVLMARAKPIAAAAKALVPVESGELRDSITASTKLSKHQKREAEETASYVEVYVGAGPLPHAHLVEFGSVNNQPQPYMRPAWDSAKGALLDQFKEDLWSEIQKTVDKLARKADHGRSADCQAARRSWRVGAGRHAYPSWRPPQGARCPPSSST